MDHEPLREEAAWVSRRMSESGLVVGTSGNVSARTPDDNALIMPSGLDHALMEPEDIVLVDLDAKVLEGPFEASVETPRHTGTYRSRPETRGIVRTHARYSTALACLNWEMPPVHYMLTVLSNEGRVPVARYATYGTEELARNAVQALADAHRACLLRNHGTNAVGASVGEAFLRAERLEVMAEIFYRAGVAGEPVLLTPDQLAEVSAKINDYGQSKPSTAE